MPILHPRSLLKRHLAVLVLGAGLCGASAAQENAGDLVYRFSVQGIDDRVAAKPIQHALMDQGFATSCLYIDACQCFKLSSSVPLDHATLNGLLLLQGHALNGAIMVSDGTTLSAPIDHQPDR